jgi:ribosomal protein S18 acetylase RimI-like enzyme
MSKLVEYRLNKASEAEIAEHLWLCNTDFVPPLSGRVEINNFAEKIASKAMRFEAWFGGKLVGLVAVYCNDLEKRIAYITSVSVLRESTGKGIAESLIKQCIEHVKALGMRQVSLEVASDNIPAIRLYKKGGFAAVKKNAPFVTMDLYFEIKIGAENEQQT